MDDLEIPDIPVSITNDVEEHIAHVFSIFDYSQTKTIEPREIETVVRALGCCPNEKEIEELLEECDDSTMPGVIHLSRFLPVMYKKLVDYKYHPATPEAILKAFHTMDPEDRGFISKAEIKELMTSYGEPFTEDELAEMFEVAVDPATKKIQYEFYLSKIKYEPKIDLYDLTAQIEAAKPKPEKKKRLISITFDEDF